MRIQNNPSTTFTARDIRIRFANDITRKTNNFAQRISGTIVEDFNNAKKFKSLTRRIDEGIDAMREYKGELYDESESVISQMLAFIKPVLAFKLGNCGESAQLSAIVAKVNGLNNVHLAEVFTKRGKDLDHMVVYVEDKKPYIIDAWLGIADYVPNIITKYKNEYRKHFDISPKSKIVIKKIKDDYYADSLDIEFSRRQKNKLLKIYPEMQIKKYL